MAYRYRPDIDRAKGLAILLVVFGHLMSSGYPRGNAWYDTAKDIVYTFHMPFFIYLAGCTFFYGGNAENPKPDYPRFLSRRAQRLLVPGVPAAGELTGRNRRSVGVATRPRREASETARFPDRYTTPDDLSDRACARLGSSGSAGRALRGVNAPILNTPHIHPAGQRRAALLQEDLTR